MATLLPNAVQQFLDASGVPLAGGTVNFYIPTTFTRKDTWSDSGETTLNTNPIVLNAAGENPAGGIYGSGIYRQIVFDSAGNQIWDQLTAQTTAGGTIWGGTSTGSANAQAITASDFNSADGQIVSFIAGFTNTSQLTLTIGGVAIPVLKDSIAGPTACSGYEVIAQSIINLNYDAARGAFHLFAYPPLYGSLTNIVGAATVDLGTVSSGNANITSSGWTATSFGSSASTTRPIYFLSFAGAGTITYNATSMITTTGLDMPVLAGASAIAQYLGSGNWRIVQFTAATGAPYPPGLLFGIGLSNGSDATNDINFAAGNCRDSTNAVNIVASAITKQLDAAWAVGTNAGGLFSGSIANTTYHCFVIMRPDTGVVDAGYDTSVTAANRPAAYTYYRRVGSIVRSGATILAFNQSGNLFRLVTRTQDVNTTTPGTSAVTATLSVPTGVVVTAIIDGGYTNSSNGGLYYLLFTALSETDSAPSASLSSIGSTVGTAASSSSRGEFQIPTNTSAQIRYRSDTSSGSITVSIQTVGWTDTRGTLA